MSESPHVCLSPSAVTCSNFLENELDAIAKVKTTVIAPIRISTKNEAIIVAWQCSHAAKCRDTACIYARIVKQWEKENEW